MEAYKKAEQVVEDYLKVNGSELHEAEKKSVLAELERIKHSSNYLRPDSFCREHKAEKQGYVI